MKIIEQRHEGEPWLMWWLGNLLTLDTDWIKSFGIAWIFKDAGEWRFLPRLTESVSLFYNAQFFLRLAFPFGVFFGMRLSSSHLFQCGIGFKLNGRFAILFRVQSDESAARGVTGPNYGQSSAWDYGTH